MAVGNGRIDEGGYLVGSVFQKYKSAFGSRQSSTGEGAVDQAIEPLGELRRYSEKKMKASSASQDNGIRRGRIIMANRTLNKVKQ